MAATAKTIWQVPAYLPYLQPELTDEAVIEAEATIGYALPPDFLILLRQQNGGYIRYGLPDSVHDKIAGIGPYFPSLTDFDWSDCQEFVSFPLKGLVPFDGDGHWHLCLDYRMSVSAPSVTYVDIECDSQNPVAENFCEYLSSLRLDVEDECFVNASAPNDVIVLLASALGVQFDEPNSFDHGYPISRAALGTSQDPQWLWVSPNRVPRGFVRDNDRRYKQLKDALPGFGLRYPELPEVSTVLQMTDGVRHRVLETCAACGLDIQSLRKSVQRDS